MLARPPTRCVTNLERALARAEYDADFRMRVLEEGRAAQADYALANVEWHILVDAVAGLERALEPDPLVATEADHGEYDAAGAKG